MLYREDTYNLFKIPGDPLLHLFLVAKLLRRTLSRHLIYFRSFRVSCTITPIIDELFILLYFN